MVFYEGLPLSDICGNGHDCIPKFMNRRYLELKCDFDKHAHIDI